MGRRTRKSFWVFGFPVCLGRVDCTWVLILVLDFPLCYVLNLCFHGTAGGSLIRRLCCQDTNPTFILEVAPRSGNEAADRHSLMTACWHSFVGYTPHELK